MGVTRVINMQWGHKVIELFVIITSDRRGPRNDIFIFEKNGDNVDSLFTYVPGGGAVRHIPRVL